MKRWVAGVVLLILMVGGGAYWAWRDLQTPAPLPAGGALVSVAPGESFRSVCARLQAAGVVRNGWLLSLWARRQGHDRLVRSGEYRLALSPVPAQASATAVVDYGFVVHATITSGGSGYVTSPAVTIVGGGGTSATAVSQISAGVVTNITITDAGSGYTNTPTVEIAPPPVAAVSARVLPVMRVDSASLAPYDNYQIQFKSNIGAAWGNWNGGLFSPTDVTNSQYLFITNGTGFFRLHYVP